VLLQELVARPPAQVTRNRTQYLGRHPAAVRQLTAILSPSLDTTRSLVSVEPVNAEDVSSMLQAMQRHGMLPRDAIHLAVARRLGITAIVSDDDAFDQIPGMRLYKP